MTKKEAILAEKILKEATKASTDKRSALLDQYDRLVRAACTRRIASDVKANTQVEPRHHE